MRWIVYLALWLYTIAPSLAAPVTLSEWNLWVNNTNGTVSAAYILPPDGPQYTKYVINPSTLHLLPVPSLTAGTGMIAQTASNTYAARTIAAGTAINVANGSGVSGNPTITNTGVTSNVAGTAISVSGATGAVTINNTGVTSAVAGTGIGVSGATGAVTVSNTGVTSAIAGTGISVSGATGAVTISATGGGGLTHIQRVLLPAEIKALNSTAITIVAAQGSGTVIEPVYASFGLDFASVAYLAPGPLNLAYGGNLSTTTLATMGTNYNNGASVVNFYTAGLVSGQLTAQCTNVPLQAWVTTADPTLGDSNITIDVWYVVASP